MECLQAFVELRDDGILRRQVLVLADQSSLHSTKRERERERIFVENQKVTEDR